MGNLFRNWVQRVLAGTLTRHERLRGQVFGVNLKNAAALKHGHGFAQLMTLQLMPLREWTSNAAIAVHPKHRFTPLEVLGADVCDNAQPAKDPFLRWQP